MNDKELIRIIDTAIKDYSGQSNYLEGAIGALMFGRHVGWKPLLLIHDRKTLKRYESILGVEFREILPEVGEMANKSVAWKAAQKITNFWKAVSGHTAGVRSPKIDKKY